jgi:glycosyltransferase involved in cell wall biosynthesis
MLKILINSYTCCPGMGSEPGMGWNWIVHLAKHCELFVITEGEYRAQIEAWMDNPENAVTAGRLHFYYNPVSESIRKMCWNQGDWRFYKYYKDWQLKTAEIAREICKREKIDILHQLNMIGFREPGYLWLVSQETGIPFVWGPIGGLKQFPLPYAKGGGIKMKAFLRLKNFLNIWQLKHDNRVDKAFKQASLLISSIPDSYQAIKKYKGLESVIIPETGTFIGDNDNGNDNVNYNDNSGRFYGEKLTVLWVGKFDFRKRLDIAIRTTAKARDAGVKMMLKVYGAGSHQQQQTATEMAQGLGITDSIEWMGNRPNSEVTEEMRKADMLLFTSVNEDTSTVVLEAISNRLPILCFDACGMAAVVNNDIGYKIPLTNPEQSVKDFATKIGYLYQHRERLVEMSANCIARQEELSWQHKAEYVAGLYRDLSGK